VADRSPGKQTVTGIEPSDGDLIALVRDKRDQQAMALLYDRYERAVYALALHLVREPRSAEDIAHDVFLNFWRKPEGYDPVRGTFGPWILRVTRNRSIDVLRKRGRERTQPDDEEGSAQDRLVDPEPAVDDQVWSRAVAREVRAALLGLTETQRQVIELAYFQGMTQSEMADHLGIPLGTVKTRVRTALQRLAALMDTTRCSDAV
jgi:RNA polymerase sigma-70 factor (ECF subfamily)